METFFKGNFNIFSNVRRIFSVASHLVNALRSRCRRVLQNARLEADVQHVAVHAVRGGWRCGHWKALLLCVRQQIQSALEATRELGISPGHDRLDFVLVFFYVKITGYLELRSKSGAAKLEPDLVISLSGRSVCKVGDVPLQSRSDKASADDWTCQTCAHEVTTLVLQPTGHPRPGEITHKLTL